MESEVEVEAHVTSALSFADLALSSASVHLARLPFSMHHQSYSRFARSTFARLSRTNRICRECRRDLTSSAERRSASSISPESRKPFYVTTPIFYVNAAPHVGHLYSMVLGDVIKRFAVLRGEKAVSLTGTDEHGMKVQRAAEKAHTEPKAFCDQGADVFKVLEPPNLACKSQH